MPHHYDKISVQENIDEEGEGKWRVEYPWLWFLGIINRNVIMKSSSFFYFWGIFIEKMLKDQTFSSSFSTLLWTVHLFRGWECIWKLLDFSWAFILSSWFLHYPPNYWNLGEERCTNVKLFEGRHVFLNIFIIGIDAQETVVTEVKFY